MDIKDFIQSPEYQKMSRAEKDKALAEFYSSPTKEEKGPSIYHIGTAFKPAEHAVVKAELPGGDGGYDPNSFVASPEYQSMSKKDRERALAEYVNRKPLEEEPSPYHIGSAFRPAVDNAEEIVEPITEPVKRIAIQGMEKFREAARPKYTKDQLAAMPQEEQSPYHIGSAFTTTVTEFSKDEYRDMTPEQLADVHPFRAGMSQNVINRLAGSTTVDLKEDPTFVEELQFLLGKGIADLPVYAGLGAASTVAKLGMTGGSALVMGGYEALDKASDLYSRDMHGKLRDGEEDLSWMAEIAKAGAWGAAKGAIGHKVGELLSTATGVIGSTAVRAMSKKAVTKADMMRVATGVNIVKGMGGLAYLAGQEEAMGRMSAMQHGYEYDMRERALGWASTAAYLGGSSAGRTVGKSIRTLVDGAPPKPKIEGSAILDNLLQQSMVKNPEVAGKVAKRFFKKGNSPEESAMMTVAEIRKRVKSEGTGHPFKDPARLDQFIEDVATKAYDLHSKNYNQFELGTLVDKELSAAYLKKNDRYQQLLELRSEWSKLDQEWRQKVGNVSPEEIEIINQKKRENIDLQDKVYKAERKSTISLTAEMKRYDKFVDSQKKKDVFLESVKEHYPGGPENITAEFVHGFLELSKSDLTDMAIKANTRGGGVVKEFIVDMMFGIKPGSSLVREIFNHKDAQSMLAALRSAEATKTLKTQSYYKIIENMKQELTGEQLKGLGIYNVSKQKAWVNKKEKGKIVRDSDGKPIRVLADTGMKKLQYMIENKVITQEQFDRAMVLDKKQKEYQAVIREMMDEIWVMTNKSREIMGLSKEQPLPDYYPLVGDIANMDVFGTPRGNDATVGWLDDMEFRGRTSAGQPKNILKRLDATYVANIDPVQVLEAYTRYMVNKAYMNPVADQFMTLGKKMVTLGNKDLGGRVIKHAKYISGDVEHLPLHNLVNKSSQLAAQAMLAGNYSTYITQMSALDGVVAECGFSAVHKSMKDIMSIPGQFDQIIEMSPHLKTRTAGGDLSMADLANSAKPGMRRTLIEKGMYPIQAIDKVAAVVGWKAFYDSAIFKGLRDIDARLYADDMTIRTQASASRIDAAPVMRNAYGKNFFTLQTFFLNRFDYMVTDLFGVRPTYEFMQVVKEKDVANSIARDRGWQVEELAGGKKGYALYDPKRAFDYIAATKKMAMLLVAQAIMNFGYDAAEEFTGIPLAQPSPNPIDAWTQSKYGTSPVGYLRDGPRKTSTLSESDQNRKAAWKAVQEVATFVPVISNVVKYQDSVPGAPLSKVISSGRNLNYYMESGNIQTLLKAANDASATVGNPLYAITNKILQGWKGYERDEEFIEKMNRQAEANAKRKLKNRGLGVEIYDPRTTKDDVRKKSGEIRTR